MRLQSNLGDVNYGGRNDIDNAGKIVTGIVTRVYDKNGTADIQLQSGAFIGDNKSTDGVVNAPVQLERYSGYDEETGLSYGEYTPLEKGQRVVVAFIGSEKYKPIIIGSLPIWDKNTSNINPRVDASGESYQVRGEMIKVNKNQSYTYSNGTGEFEDVEVNGAFTVGKIHKMSDHREDGFNFEDLTLKDKKTNKTISHNRKTSLIVPFNYLRVTKDKLEDSEDCTYNRWYHDAGLGITRYSKDKKDFLFEIGIDENDKFEVRVQPKTFKRLRRDDEAKVYDRRTLRKSEDTIMRKHYKKYPNPKIEVPEIKDFTSFSIDKKGNVSLIRQTEKGISKLSFNDDGIVIDTSENVSLNTEQRVSINANSDVSIKTSGSARIDAKGSLNLNSDTSINFNAPTVNTSTNQYYSRAYLKDIEKVDTEDLRFIDPGETGTEGKGDYEW
ncbi:hypothetical protein NH288_04715 [Anaerococcus sp. NML200537]|uniref:hypothetical protein n=1 Tax=Anaerococcus sp. NML200537 TaxID=2954485 RepID=UPI002237C625|nr:hypothetical protein [Anaerococcus sp. NML200537]MCW6701385.1 hypothetical protein [Anaerococcus sp. NML200537]